MYQLTAIDYEFYKDIDNHSSVVGNICILSNKSGKRIKDQILKNIEKNINSSIIHSHKIVPSTTFKDYPFFIKDKNLNIKDHIYEHFSDKSDIKSSLIYRDIISSALDPDAPLWDIHIIYGINEQDDTAIIRRYHHCLGDSDAHQNVHNIIFDNYSGKKIKSNKKINKLNSFFNHFYKLIKSYLILIYGFIFKINHCNESYKIDKKQIHKGQFRLKKHKQNNISFFSHDISSLKNNLKKNDVTILEMCMYITSSIYKQLLPTSEDKTILTMFPISYRKRKHPNCNNMATAAKINLHLDEKDSHKRLIKIKKELRNKIIILKKGPHVVYDRAFGVDPRISKFKRNWDIFNKANWHDRKKIYKKDDSLPMISTTTSFKKNKDDVGLLSDDYVKEVYNFSTISKTVFSTGCSISYRLYGDKLNIGVIYSEDLYSDSQIFKTLFEKSIEEFKKVCD
jgi:hypothetical protein